ncbi:adenylate kinase [Botrimarina colliarenosi]|uniref:Adenylate kinase n=1 Tax=Botrimarina colliarenosi TaxID=2528001 RepID=A0A5C6ABJ7_9BACT|nr:adenylate kinase [Botrimarina colliarenosi]TWT96668.1 adenylate kinase [Botrimarina colliarenosi]
MRVVFIGPPGAGKGTQSLRVAKSLGLTHLSTGDILRKSRDEGQAIGLEAAKYFESGRLAPDELVIQLVEDRLDDPDCQNGYLFDGFPRTLRQAKALDALLAKRGKPLNAVIEFVIPEAELFVRLSSRGREDDSEETVRERLRLYASSTAPLLGYYEERGVLCRVDALGTPDEVFGRVVADLEERRTA